MIFKNLFNKFNTNKKLKAKVKKLCKNEILINFFGPKTFHPSKSKIGGNPYLPNDFIWPVFASKDDNVTRPLTFLCQINLEQVKPFDKDNILPSKGMLYFFYECESSRWGFDVDDKGAARIFYYENYNGFGLQNFPQNLSKEYIIPEIVISFDSRTSYPKYEEFSLYDNSEPEWDDYDKVLEKLGVNLDEEEVNKLLGYANIIQDEMLTECERINRGLGCGDAECYQNTPQEVEKDIEKHASDWILLFQLGTISKDDFEWMFGDSGKIYFYIKKSDLLEKNFANMQFSVQCF